MSNIAATIEAILFATADPYTVQSLSERTGASVEAVESALGELEQVLEGHGMMLVRSGAEVMLATRSEHAAVLETIRKDALSKDLSKASAETLAIICYHPGVSKSQIEFIRGVNASYSIRALEMRGLIEAKGAGRSVVYHPTLELLESYGASSIEGLPEYAVTKAKIDALLVQDIAE